MKKVIAMVLLVFAISVCLPSGAAADIKVRLNGEELRCIQEKPFLTDGVVFVPARALMEAMGGQVEWNAAERRVVLKRSVWKINLQIGNTSATIQEDMWGTKVTLPAAPQLIHGCAMVPLRAVAEAFCADVVWDAAYQSVHITAPRNIPVEISSKELADAIRYILKIPADALILETHVCQIKGIGIDRYGMELLLKSGVAISLPGKTYAGVEKLSWVENLRIQLVDGCNPSDVLRLPRLTSVTLDDARETKDNWDYYTIIGQHPNIESLTIYQYDGPFDLRKMTALRSLTIEDCSARDLSNLPFEQLDSLSITNSNVNNAFFEKEAYNLSGLESARKLKWLTLSRMNISDISLLNGLPLLENLELTYCGIRNVSVLNTLSKVISVNLMGNLISDITPLFSCKALEKLNVRDNLISGNLEICHMLELKELNLSANEITALTVENTPKLEKLLVNENQLCAPPEISGVTPEIFNEDNPYTLREWLTEEEHAQIIRDVLKDYFSDDKAAEILQNAIYDNTVYLKIRNAKPEWIPQTIGKLKLCPMSADEIREKTKELGCFFLLKIDIPLYSYFKDQSVVVQISCDPVGTGESVARSRNYTLVHGKDGKWEIEK